MNRLLLFGMLLLGAVGAGPVAAQSDGGAGLPPRPTPFKFVNDQASLMAPADAKKLDSGLRRYADNTGTQIVVVTVPSLGGRPAADYARALGTAWGVGQREKNNGIVVLLGAQEHKVSIQPGSGLQSVITPAVTSRVINEMMPGFKQNNYFAGLRTGLNTLMVTANPSSAKDATAATKATAATTGAVGNTASTKNSAANLAGETPQSPATTRNPVTTTPVEPVSSGPGMGTLLIGALVVGGILWLVVRMFRGRSGAADNPTGTPNFLPNRSAGPTGPTGGSYGPNSGNYGPGPGNGPTQSSGPGIGGMLATGAAAAAGAYLGNRLASGHDTAGNSMTNDNNTGSLGGTGAGAAGAAGAASSSAGSDYFNSRDGSGGADNPAPDYFSDANTAPDNSGDAFSSDDNSSSYDDNSSGDTGGGDFDGTSDNSGSW